MKRTLLRELVVVALLSMSWVGLVDLLTNELDTRQLSWDFRHYIAMAEYGPEFDHHVAPYAYRIGLTLPVHLLQAGFGVPVHSGFKLTAYLGAWLTLLLVYVYLRWAGFSPAIGVLGSFVVACSHYHVKFLMFDVYRPDHMAYPLMVMAMMALISERWLLVIVVCVIGIQVREFLVVPLLILTGQQVTAATTRASLRRRAVLVAAIGLAALLLAVIMPRLLIPVVSSQQNVDPWNNPATLGRLITDLLDPGKCANLLLALLTYLAPVLLLLTPRRARRVWARLAPRERCIYCWYVALVLVLAVYGGTDYNRFVTYLFLPQVVVLGHLVSSRVQPAEIAYMLVVVVLVNKIVLPIPIWDLDAYLDWFGGYGGRVNATTFMKYAQLVLAVIGAMLIRWLLGRGEHGGRHIVVA